MIEQVCLSELFLDSTKEIFETMIFMDILETDEPDQHIEGDAILSSITFKGDMEGCLAICCGKTCAEAITMNMLGFDSVEGITDDDICDATGEVVNMVMGGMKRRLHETCSNIELSIPLVVKGQQLKNELGEAKHKITANVQIEGQYPAELSFLYRQKAAGTA